MNRPRTAALLAASLAACSHAAPRPEVVWPYPPDKPRIRFVQAIASKEDLDTSSWVAIRRLLFGYTMPATVHQPMGFALSDDGQRLYVADYRASQVVRIDFQNKDVDRVLADEVFAAPFNVALDGQEDLFVSDSLGKRVVKYSRDGKLLCAVQKGVERPTGLALDRAQGILYVADSASRTSQNHRVLAYDLECRFVREVGRGRGSGDGQFFFPTYLALDKDGNLFVADTLNFRIQVFDRTGRFLRAFGEQGDSPGTLARTKGLAFDGFGNLYAVDGQHSAVQIFNSHDQLLMWFGGFNPKVLEYFDIPSAIAIDPRTNRIYVGNEENGRVNVYELVNTTAEDSLAPGPSPAAPAAPSAAPPAGKP